MVTWWTILDSSVLLHPLLSRYPVYFYCKLFLENSFDHPPVSYMIECASIHTTPCIPEAQMNAEKVTLEVFLSDRPPTATFHKKGHCGGIPHTPRPGTGVPLHPLRQ